MLSAFISTGATRVTWIPAGMMALRALCHWAKSGASVPLIGFGHLLFKGVKEAVDKQGFIGTFYGGLESAAVGISGALIMGYLASLVFKSKMK
mgnify:CR=1 FL=1